MEDFVANPHHTTVDVEELDAVVEAIVEEKPKKSKKEETAE
jgi:hypothetical protein